MAEQSDEGFDIDPFVGKIIITEYDWWETGCDIVTIIQRGAAVQAAGMLIQTPPSDLYYADSMIAGSGVDIPVRLIENLGRLSHFCCPIQHTCPQ